MGRNEGKFLAWGWIEGAVWDREGSDGMPLTWSGSDEVVWNRDRNSGGREGEVWDRDGRPLNSGGRDNLVWDRGWINVVLFSWSRRDGVVGPRLWSDETSRNGAFADGPVEDCVLLAFLCSGWEVAEEVSAVPLLTDVPTEALKHCAVLSTVVAVISSPENVG